MRLALDTSSTANQISHYGDGQFTIHQRNYRQNLVISSNKLLTPWTQKTITELTIDDLTPILSCQPKIILLGTGDTLVFPHPSLVAHIQTLGIGCEVMDTAAACRTFNVLVSEGRNVVAGLLLSAHLPTTNPG